MWYTCFAVFVTQFNQSNHRSVILLSSVPWIWPLLIWLDLIAVCGWLISTQHALDLLNEPKLTDEAAEDKPNAAVLLKLCGQREKLQRGLSVCSILCFTLTGAFTVTAFDVRFRPMLTGMPVNAVWFRIVSAVVLLLVTAFLLQLFGHVIPVFLAGRDAEKTILRRRRLLVFSAALAQIIAAPAQKLSRPLLRLAGADPDAVT